MLILAEKPGLSPTSSQSYIPRKQVHSSSLTSLRKSWLTLAFHKDVEDPGRPYARYYSFRRTRDKLIVRHSYQWIFTLILLGLIVLTLWRYEQYQTITQTTKHIFNSIITGLSIALGINIASALKSYAEMMRWRFLTMSWMSLREFDLILHCGSLHKVVQLLWDVAVKQPGFPNARGLRIWGIAWGWIVLNLLAQVLVAMIGLTYSLDVSAYDSFQPGLVSIVNLSTIHDHWSIGSGAEVTPMIQMYAAHAYGIQGQDNNLGTLGTSDEETYGCYGTLWTDEDRSFAGYKFVDINPDVTGGAVGQANTCSNRDVVVIASCNHYVVSNLGGSPADGHTAYYKDSEDKEQQLYVREATPGGTTWMGDTDRSACLGMFDLADYSRSAKIMGFQMAQQSNPNEPNEILAVQDNHVFECCNYVSVVSNLTGSDKRLGLAAEQAFYISGAIGWTGFAIPGVSGGSMNPDEQYVVYPYGAEWAFDTDAYAGNAAAIVQQYSAAAIAQLDISGKRANITSERQPNRSSCLTVEWHWTIPLLGCIFLVQCLSMLVVILWANKALIIDDSFLSISKLLAPTVVKLGDHGSVLKGEEIAEGITKRHSKPGAPYKIFYGCRDLNANGVSGDSGSDVTLDGRRASAGSFYGRGLLRAGIFEEGGEIRPKKDRPFVDGTYD